MTEPLTLTCGEVAQALGYYVERGKHRGEPNRRLVRTLATSGRIPPPIDPALTVARWRWSRADIESYVSGARRSAS